VVIKYSVELRSVSVQLLGSMGKQQPDMALLLLPMLEDTEESVRVATVAALKNLNQSMEIVTPQLVYHLQNDTSPQVRALVVKALIRIDDSSKNAAIPKLRSLLNVPDSHLRYDVIMALGSMEKSAQAVLPELLPLLRASEPQIRSISAWAIGKIDQPRSATIVQLLPLLKDKKISVQKSAREALEKLGYRPASRFYVDEE
jgi:HEAT repeat protein